MKRLISCLLSALISAFSLSATATDGQLAADEAYAAAERGEILIIDVRTPAEWRETGIPKGAKAVEFGASNFLDRMVEAVASDRSRPVALICRSGNRSTRAVDTLRTNGFSHVLNIREGMSGGSFGPGWLKRGLPIQEEVTR